MHTAELDTAVWSISGSFLRFFYHLTPYGVMLTAEHDSAVYDAHQGVWPGGVIHTAEIDSASGMHMAEFLKN